MKRSPFLTELSHVAQQYLDSHPQPQDRNRFANFFFPHTNHSVANNIKIIADNARLTPNPPHTHELQFWLQVNTALSTLSASATHKRLPLISCSSSLLSSVLTLYNRRIHKITSEFNRSTGPDKQLRFIESIATYKPYHPSYSILSIITQMEEQIKRILLAVSRSSSMVELNQLNSPSMQTNLKPRSHSTIPLRPTQAVTHNNDSSGESKSGSGSLTVQTQVSSTTIKAHSP